SSQKSEEHAPLENCRARCRHGLSLVADSARNGGSFLGKENRKHLQTARPKYACATEQVKSPHPSETFAVTICETGPGAAEVFLPGAQGRVVIRPDVLDVFNNENAFRSARQMGKGRKHGVWENVALDPGIGVDA